MNYPLDTIDDTLAFAIRGEYDKRVYPANLGNGGGITRRHRCAWCINCDGATARTIAFHYYKEGWSNFLGGGSSLMRATATIEVYELYTKGTEPMNPMDYITASATAVCAVASAIFVWLASRGGMK